MKRSRKQINSLTTYFGTLLFIIFILLLIATTDNKNRIVVSNVNTIKSVEASRIMPIEGTNSIENYDEFVKVSSVFDIETHKNEKIEFTGTLTGYGPDCVGCSGKLGCSPYQNVQNGNIYYEDSKYGKIRILAADPSIPCGSIVKISNYKNVDGDFYGIVLDRGSAIKGLTMDLLYNSEAEVKALGRTYDVNFRLERWGY